MMRLSELEREHLTENAAMFGRVLELLTRSYPTIAGEIEPLRRHTGESLAILCKEHVHAESD